MILKSIFSSLNILFLCLHNIGLVSLFLFSLYCFPSQLILIPYFAKLKAFLSSPTPPTYLTFPSLLPQTKFFPFIPHIPTLPYLLTPPPLLVLPATLPSSTPPTYLTFLPPPPVLPQTKCPPRIPFTPPPPGPTPIQPLLTPTSRASIPTQFPPAPARAFPV